MEVLNLSSAGAVLLLLLFVECRILSVTPQHTSSQEIIEDEDSPSQFLSYIHDPEPREALIHQLSKNLLQATKELLSFQPRASRSSSNSSVLERLKVLQGLDPQKAGELLAQQGIVVPPLEGVRCDANAQHYRTLDGSCNNLQYPCWGKADEPYQRWLPSAYSNGIDEPRRLKLDGSPLPSPRQVYQWVSSQLIETPNTTYRNINNMVVLWGQMLSHDILLTPTVTAKVWDGFKFNDEAPDCCRNSHAECIPIHMDYDDVFYPRGHCMDIIRSSAYVYSPFSCRPFKLGLPREQMNQITSFIDASCVYGSSVDQMRGLRENNGLGAKMLMEYSTGWSCPPRRNKTCKVSHRACDKRCFKTGERRANENPLLGAMHTMWNREHNRLVEALQERRWPQETLFHVVRKIVGATIQHITYNEFVPLLIGKILADHMNLSVPSSNYRYDGNLNPTLYNAFVTAAFRYGHSMVSGRNVRGGFHSSLTGSPLLSGDFFSMDDFCGPQPQDPVVVLLSGTTTQKAQKVDCLFSKQITNHLFAKTANGRGMDLFSVNLQRGRDHGIPPYTRWRQTCGLSAVRDYSDLKRYIPEDIVDRLAVVYGPGGVDDIDLYVGGISEFPVNGGVLGPTFTCIVANQLKNLKFGDRFWYENLDHAGAFTQDQIRSLQRTTLASLLCRNSPLQETQRMAFLMESPSNPKIRCEDILRETDLDLRLWP